MSKIKLSGIGITWAGGKTGTTVFFKNRGGPCTRILVNPTLVQNSYTSFVRDNLTTLSQMWRTLTESDRQSWFQLSEQQKREDYPGQILTIQPNVLFVGINQNLNRIGFPPITTAVPFVTQPEWWALPPEPWNEGDSYIEWSDCPSEWFRVAFSTSNISPGIYNFKKLLRFIQYSPGGTGYNMSIDSSFEGKYGAKPTAGYKVGLKCFLINQYTGQATPPILLSGIVT